MKQLIDWEDFDADSAGTFAVSELVAILRYEVAQEPDGDWAITFFGKYIATKASREEAKNYCELDTAARLSRAYQKLGDLIGEVLGNGESLPTI